ncbi:hypothetical protein TCAL_16429 [Tigriopus californicus]|uniref:Uncharacterized protein n=1 Tax=Tigriopus californicus TaxID=6832 RepID=A0A553NYG9_TIGCA|nr:hypothetical protein TCAL_16429 [Tigriopus californicus]
MWGRLKGVLVQITIEPMLFLGAFSTILTLVPQNQLILYKTCLVPEFELSEEFCQQINQNANTTEYQDLIEPAVAQFNVFTVDGEQAVQYLYVVRIFTWGVNEYSAYTTVSSLISSCGICILAALKGRNISTTTNYPAPKMNLAEIVETPTFVARTSL